MPLGLSGGVGNVPFRLRDRSHLITRHGGVKGFYRDGRGRARPITKKKGLAAVAAAGVAVVIAYGGGGGLGGAGGAAESFAGQSLRAKISHGKNAARKGRRHEAWRRMEVRSLRRTVREAADCVRHSFGEVRDFLVDTPCRSLHRELLAVADPHGNVILVSIAWVRMHDAGDATRFRDLIDVHGSGDIRPIAAALEIGDVTFTGHHYGSGTHVVVVETETAAGSPPGHARRPRGGGVLLPAR